MDKFLLILKALLRFGQLVIDALRLLDALMRVF